MSKFNQVAFKKEMIKVDGVWYDCDPKAKGYAGKVFNEGDEVELVTEDRDGKPFVTKVCKPGGSTGGASASSSSSSSSSSASSTSKSSGRKYSGGKTPEESERISRLSLMSSASSAVQVLTGQLSSPDELKEVVLDLYKAMAEEVLG